MAHSADDGVMRETENWLARKSNVAHASVRDMGKWTDKQAKYVLSNIDSLAHKYGIEPKLSDTIGDLVANIKRAMASGGT